MKMKRAVRRIERLAPPWSEADLEESMRLFRGAIAAGGGTISDAMVAHVRQELARELRRSHRSEIRAAGALEQARLDLVRWMCDALPDADAVRRACAWINANLPA